MKNVGDKAINNCIVVNLFGAPGTGKSTGAAYIFSELKMAGVNAEIITEFAKDKVWENTKEAFKPDNQCYLFGEQFYRMNRCRDKVDVIVTDSPLPLCVLYNKSMILGEEFNQVVMNCFNSFTNLSYLLRRVKPYSQIGRIHTEQESDLLFAQLSDLVVEREINNMILPGDKEGYDRIVHDVLEKIGANNEKQ